MHTPTPTGPLAVRAHQIKDLHKSFCVVRVNLFDGVETWHPLLPAKAGHCVVRTFSKDRSQVTNKEYRIEAYSNTRPGVGVKTSEGLLSLATMHGWRIRMTKGLMAVVHSDRT